MARGYPDFFSHPMFPSFGELQEQPQLDALLLNGETETIFNITGKAVIFGGRIRLLPATNLPNNITFHPVLDGNVMVTFTVYAALVYNWVDQWDQIIFLTEYSTEGSAYNFTFSHDIPVATSFRLDVQNTTGGNLIINGELYYHVVR